MGRCSLLCVVRGARALCTVGVVLMMLMMLKAMQDELRAAVWR